MNKKQTDFRKNRGGYSGTGMPPMYALSGSLMFMLAPTLGWVMSIGLICTIGLIITKVVEKYFTPSIEVTPTAKYLKAVQAWRDSDIMSSQFPKYESTVKHIPSRYTAWHRKVTIQSKQRVSTVKSVFISPHEA